MKKKDTCTSVLLKLHVLFCNIEKYTITVNTLHLFGHTVGLKLEETS